MMTPAPDTPSREDLLAIARADFDLRRPASADQREPYARAFAAIAGWKTPACPSRARPVILESQHG